MKRDEIRFLLTARRPSGADDADPRVAEALASVGQDRELDRWFRSQAAEDAALAARIGEVRPPEGLRERILAGPGVVPLRRPRRSWVPALAWAAALVVLFAAGGLGWRQWRAPVPVAVAERDLVAFLDRKWDHSFDLSSAEFSRLQAWLEARPEPARFDVPASLAASRTYGCKTFRYRGRDVSLVCFVPTGSGSVVHVFSLEASGVATELAEAPRMGRVEGWSTAAWRRGAQVYFAVSPAPQEALRGWL